MLVSRSHILGNMTQVEKEKPQDILSPRSTCLGTHLHHNQEDTGLAPRKSEANLLVLKGAGGVPGPESPGTRGHWQGLPVSGGLRAGGFALWMSELRSYQGRLSKFTAAAAPGRLSRSPQPSHTGPSLQRLLFCSAAAFSSPCTDNSRK